MTLAQPVHVARNIEILIDAGIPAEVAARVAALPLPDALRAAKQFVRWGSR